SLLSQSFFHFQGRAAKAHHLLADTPLNDFVEPDKRTTANEKNLLSINLDVFLVRMFAAALRRNVAHTALQNFQKRLLYSFAGDIARHDNVIGFAADLIDFVDVNDADLGSFHIVIGILEESEKDVFHVFADMPRFRELS